MSHTPNRTACDWCDTPAAVAVSETVNGRTYTDYACLAHSRQYAGTYGPAVRTRRIRDMRPAVRARHRARVASYGASSRTLVTAVVLWGAAIAGGILASSPAAPASPEPAAHVSPYPAWVACTNEDSAGPCYWHAGIMGNGYGTSFTRDADGRMVMGQTYGTGTVYPR